MSIESIESFLKHPREGGIYSDAALVLLLGHAESGQLSYFSCCCFAGIPTAKHGLQGELPDRSAISKGYKEGHEDDVFPIGRWVDASQAFLELGATDEERRAKLIPLVKVEILKRAAECLRSQVEVSEPAVV